MKRLVDQWGLIVFQGVVAMLFGILALVWPGATANALLILFAAYLLVDGVARIVGGIRATDASGGSRGFAVVLGVIDIAAAAVALLWPGLTILVLVVIAASWAVLMGVVTIGTGFAIRKEVTGEGLLYVVGAIGVVVGAVLFLRPGAGVVAFAWTIGVGAVTWGLALVALGVRLRRFKRTGEAAPV